MSIISRQKNDSLRSINRSNKRKLHTKASFFIKYWAVFGAVTHLYSIFIAYLTPQVHVALHLLFTLSMVFLLFKAQKTEPLENESISWYDYILSGLSLLVTGYILFDWQGILVRIARPNQIDIIFAIIALVLILEGTRRVMGLALPIIALVFVAYAFLGNLLPGFLGHRGATLSRFASMQYMAMEGIWSSPVQVSSKMIFMFTLFGSVLLFSGAGEKLMGLAWAFAGRYAGGPGKVAVVSSGLMGMVSGSASANVATTGQFTIPMMKRMGFTARMAGAIEAVASTGGTLAPPVMGAGAFIMTEILGISYFSVIKAAAIPAIIYYISAFFVVHFESKRLGLKGMPKSELPSKVKAVKDGMMVIIPILLLLYLVFTYYPILRSALISTGCIILVSFFTKKNKMTIQKIVDALADGMTGMITLALCCASAGIVVGCIAMTGLGPKFATVLLVLAGNAKWIALVISMIVTIILGMGLPPTAAYVVAASVAAPALLKLGFEPLGTQMFIFYFSCLAQITPPVAMAAFVGASIAGTDPLKTAITSMRLGLVALIIPFMFIGSPTLLMEGNIGSILWDTGIAIVGVVVCSIGLIGYFQVSMNIVWRILCIAGGLLLIQPGLLTDAIGAILIVVVLGYNMYQYKINAGRSPTQAGI
jgi:TRAP transporter 4TM/12TM fusion protein